MPIAAFQDPACSFNNNWSAIDQRQHAVRPPQFRDLLRDFARAPEIIGIDRRYQAASCFSDAAVSRSGNVAIGLDDDADALIRWRTAARTRRDAVACAVIEDEYLELPPSPATNAFERPVIVLAAL